MLICVHQIALVLITQCILGAFGIRLTFKAENGQLRGFNDMTNDHHISMSVTVIQIP